jgi:hypothetical protein
LQQKTRDVLVTDTENQGLLVETFKGILTLKTNNAAPQAWEELQSRFGHLANVAFCLLQIGIINNVFSTLVSGLGSLAVPPGSPLLESVDYRELPFLLLSSNFRTSGECLPNRGC